MRDTIYERVIQFLEDNYIDTEYYLSDEARELIEEGTLSIKYIENLPASDMEYWLDTEKLILTESIQ